MACITNKINIKNVNDKTIVMLFSHIFGENKTSLSLYDLIMYVYICMTYIHIINMFYRAILDITLDDNSTIFSTNYKLTCNVLSFSYNS